MVLIVSFEGDEYCGNGFQAKVLKDSEGLRENADVKSALRTQCYVCTDEPDQLDIHIEVSLCNGIYLVKIWV